MFFLDHFAELFSLRWDEVFVERDDVRVDASTFVDGVLPFVGWIGNWFVGLTRSRGSQSHHLRGLSFFLFLGRVMGKWRQNPP